MLSWQGKGRNVKWDSGSRESFEGLMKPNKNTIFKQINWKLLFGSWPSQNNKQNFLSKLSNVVLKDLFPKP